MILRGLGVSKPQKLSRGCPCILFLVLAGCSAQYDTFQPVTSLPAGFNKETINHYLLTQYENVLNEQSRAIYYRDDKYLGDEIVAEGSSTGVATKQSSI
jgi:hypothetical protein